MKLFYLLMKYFLVEGILLYNLSNYFLISLNFDQFLEGEFTQLRICSVNIYLFIYFFFIAGELDEEMLELTATLLVKNPDAYTFWNIRRATRAICYSRKRSENKNSVSISSSKVSD